MSIWKFPKKGLGILSMSLLKALMLGRVSFRNFRFLHPHAES